MIRIAFALLFAASMSGCARAPAPAEPAAAAASTAATPAPAESKPAINGDPCWSPRQAGDPQPQFLPDSPVGVLVRFYDLHAPDIGRGVPEADRLETYKPLLTHPLIAALERARAERDAAMASAPGEKPPFVEGELFASLFEGYTAVQPLALATEGEEARVRTCFAYASDSGRSEWVDTVVLRREDDTWRIDDVVYGGQWDFANTGRLREQLPAGE